MAIRVDFNVGPSFAPVWQNITEFVRSVSISRGKDELLDGFSAGAATIELDNRDRRFDPLFASSPYEGSIVPRRGVRVFSDYDPAVTNRTNLVLNPRPGYFVSAQPLNWYTDLGTAERPDVFTLGTTKFVYIAEATRPYRSVFVTFDATPNFVHTISGLVTLLPSLDPLPAGFKFVVNVQFFTEDDVATGLLSTNSRSVNGVLTTSLFAPDDANYAVVEFTTSPYWTASPSPTVRELVVEVGSQVSTFYDGDSTDTAEITYAWAGTAGDSVSTVTFDNPDPGLQFVGFITDWDLSYSLGGDNTALIKASDGFSLLANQVVQDEEMPIELSGFRISRLLSDPNINYEGSARNIQPGTKFLGNDVTDNDNALSYFQQIELSELGQFFVAKNGDVTFLDASQNNPSPVDSVQTFADDGSGVQFTSLEVVFGTEQLTSTLTVTWPGGSETATNAESVGSYGVTSLSIDTLNQNETDAAYLASYYTIRFGEPQYRVDSITVNVYSLSDEDQTAVLALELGDVVTLKFTPGGVSPQIVQYAKVVRINSTIVDAGKRYELEFGLENFQDFPIVLNDAEYGKIGEDYVLGF